MPDAPQHDRVTGEPTDEPTACAGCSAPLDAGYYRVDNRSVCNACYAVVWEQHFGTEGRGRRVRGALMLGLLAAGAGAVLYYGVARLTGYEFGLVAIVVGLMVGFAVRQGCRRRGGWTYQGLAMGLTWLAVGAAMALTFVDAAVSGKLAQDEDAPVAQTAPAASTAAAPSEGQPDELRAKGPVRLALLALIFCVIAVIGPALVGFESPISLLLVGIALYEAWVVNKRKPPLIEGPFGDEGGA
jgi:hypothetical protein